MLNAIGAMLLQAIMFLMHFAYSYDWIEMNSLNLFLSGACANCARVSTFIHILIIRPQADSENARRSRLHRSRTFTI